MIKPSLLENEKERIETLNSYNVLDTILKDEYDSLTFIASQTCDTSISFVSLIDPKRQWFKSHNKPSQITSKQIKALKGLANKVLSLFELRNRSIFLEINNKFVSQLNERLESFTARLNHDLRAIEYGDNGTGISINKREKVFNLFENFDNHIKNSTGVGLATLKSVIERLEGEITICDRFNQERGVKFDIYLPIE